MSYHISKKGEPVVCPAQIKCRLGGKHFDTKGEAEQYLSKELSAKSSYGSLSKSDRSLGKMDDFTLASMRSKLKRIESSKTLMLDKKAESFFKNELKQKGLGSLDDFAGPRRGREFGGNYDLPITSDNKSFFNEVAQKISYESERRNVRDAQLLDQYTESHFNARKSKRNTTFFKDRAHSNKGQSFISSKAQGIKIIEGRPYEHITVKSSGGAKDREIHISVDNDLTGEERDMIAKDVSSALYGKPGGEQKIDTTSEKARAILNNESLSSQTKAAAFYSKKDPAKLQSFDKKVSATGSTRRDLVKSYDEQMQKLYGI